ncbi:MAG TPA: gamma-glutamyl-gamma-aminobutyrate hydrolase family protein [Acidobacteriaceae bacterium]
MISSPPRIAIPEPSSIDKEYSEGSWPDYARAVEAAGGTAVRVPLTESQATVAQLAGSCAGILLPGNGADVNPEKYGQKAIPECGATDPLRESVDDLLLQDAFNLNKAIFGICYGLQTLNVWRNGTLVQDLPTSKPTGSVEHAAGPKVLEAHLINIARPSYLANIVDLTSVLDLSTTGQRVEKTGEQLQLLVNSSHHQAVAQPGDQLEVVALSAEDGVIEALERVTADQFVIGVQWHPERTYETSAASRELFRAFVEAASAWKPRPIHASVSQ